MITFDGGPPRTPAAKFARNPYAWVCRAQRTISIRCFGLQFGASHRRQIRRSPNASGTERVTHASLQAHRIPNPDAKTLQVRGFQPNLALLVILVLLVSFPCDSRPVHSYYPHAVFNEERVPPAVTEPLDLAGPKPWAFHVPSPYPPGIGMPLHRPGISKCKVPTSPASNCKIPFLPPLNLIPDCPPKPSLCTGFDYTTSSLGSSSTFMLDYFHPVKSTTGSVFFVEARFDKTNFWNQDEDLDESVLEGTHIDPGQAASDRLDFSVGTGWRKLLPSGVIAGFNGFVDSFRLDSTWHSSVGGGVELTMLTLTDRIYDVRFNACGNLFNRAAVVSSFPEVGPSYELEAGMSTPVHCRAFDLRVKLGGYRFDIGKLVDGVKAGLELRSWDGVFAVGWEHSYDKFNGHFDSFRGFVHASFDWRNVFNCWRTLSAPELLLAGQRNIRSLLSRSVDRR